MDSCATPTAPPRSTRIGFAAAVVAHGDAWRVNGACAHWKAGRQLPGYAMFRADHGNWDAWRDYYLMRDFLPGGIYADRPRAWGGLPA